MTAFLWAILAALAWGSAAFFEKIGVGRADPDAGVLARAIGVMLGATALFLFVPQAPAKFSGMGVRSLLCLMAGGMLASIVGQIFFYRALKMGEIGRVAAVGGAWPCVAFLLSMVFLHETPTPKTVAGVVLVITGVALLR